MAYKEYVKDSVNKNTEDSFHLELVAEPDLPMTKIGICVNEPLRDFLSKIEIKSAFVTIIARKNGLESFRKVFPILDGFTHVTYPSPGRYEVEAIVGYSFHKNVERHTKKALNLRANYHSYTINSHHYDEYKFGWIRNDSFNYHNGHKSMNVHIYPHSSFKTVIVSDGHFAKPPSNATMSLINTFYDSKGVDQCATRKRKIGTAFRILAQPFAYSFKAIMFIAFMLIGLVYENGFKHIFKPGIRGGWRKVFGTVRKDRSAYFYKPKVNGYGNRTGYEDRSKLWSISFVAFWFVLITFTIGYIIDGVQYGILTIFMVSSFLALIVASGFAIDYITSDRTKEYLKRRKQNSYESDQDLFNKNLEELSCNAVQGNLDNLVKRRKNAPIVLYHNAKDKVCRPYAKSD